MQPKDTYLWSSSISSKPLTYFLPFDQESALKTKTRKYQKWRKWCWNYFFLFTCTSICVQHSESLIWKHLWDQKVRWLSSGNKKSLICLQLGSWQPQSTCGVTSLNMNYLTFLTDCQRLIAYNLLIWGYTKTTSIRNRFHQLLMKSASLVLSLPYVLIS